MTVVGIDEVGRGAWAGPLVVGAVLLGGAPIDQLTDSKLLTKKQRQLLDSKIRKTAQGIGLGWVSAKDIDTIGLSRALKLATRRALAHIRADYHEIVIDGTVKFVNDPRVTVMKKADLLVPSVSAASIVAKVARDNYMKHLDGIFPGYKFANHVGYGTAAHRAAIALRGVTPLHRLSYAPLTSYLMTTTDDFEPRREKTPADEAWVKSLTTKQIGDRAETVVAHYLIRQGHAILERNWKTKYCEIDIISTKNDTTYFTEVKYRKTNLHGNGLEVVTNKKRRQMSFAADYYVATKKLTTSLCLAVADVAGEPAELREYIELRS